MTPNPNPTGEGRVVRCERCGGVITLVSIEPRVRCSFCQHDQAVPAALLSELAHYQHGVAQHDVRARAHDNAEYGARMEAINNPFSLGALIIAFAPVVIFGGGNELVKALELLPPATQSDVDQIVQGGTGLWLVGGTAGYIWYRRTFATRRARGAPPREGLGSVSCPSCGAPNAFMSGQLIERCRHCSAALAPSTGVIQRGLDAARLHARRALLDRCRSERASSMGMIVMPAVLDGVIQIVLFFVLALMGLAAAYFAPFLILHKEPSLAPHTTLVTTGSWIVGILLAVAAIVQIVLMVGKQSAWQIAHIALAWRLGGVRVDAAGMRRWLDAYWVGPFNTSHFEMSAFGNAFTTNLDGFPVLVIVDTVPESKERSPKLTILVAAIFANASAAPEISPTLRRYLHDQGFYGESTDGGVHANASSDTLSRLHKKPSDVLALAAMPGKMVAWAKENGEPAPAW